MSKLTDTEAAEIAIRHGLKLEPAADRRCGGSRLTSKAKGVTLLVYPRSYSPTAFDKLCGHLAAPKKGRKS